MNEPKTDIHPRHSSSSSEKLIRLLIGICCTSLGFGLSQLTVAGTVREHAVELKGIKKDFESEQKRTDTRIYEVASLVRDVINDNRNRTAQTGELIALIRAQNEMIQQNRRLQ